MVWTETSLPLAMPAKGQKNGFAEGWIPGYTARAFGR
jgi:hypothetical protein